MAIETLNLAIQGMTCENCARGIKRKLLGIPGVAQTNVSLEAANATVEYDTDLVRPEALARAVRDLGYEAS
jgi:copper chaperone CopZ